MKIKNKLIYAKALLLFLVTGLSMSLSAQFPYFTSGNSATEFYIVPSSGTSGGAVVGGSLAKGVQLTTNKTYQQGGVILKNLNFTTAKGFVVSFEYEMSSPLATGLKGGDGIAMVLFDGAVSNPTIGAFGSGLGYGYAVATKTGTPNKAGFTKGYLAVALDYFGNFHRRAKTSTESRNGIELGTSGDHKSFITIRGPYNPTDELKGYPVLFTRSTEHLTGQVMRLTTDTSDPDYNTAKYKSYIDILPFDFSIQNNAYSVAPSIKGYRKVTISLLPSQLPNGDKVFYMTLKIQHETFETTIIEDFIFYENKNIKYKEISKYFPTNLGEDTVWEVPFKTPATLKMAFTASTGEAYQAQFVRNIEVTLPFSPITADDMRQDLCYSCGTSSIPIFYNDIGYNSNIYYPNNPPVGSNSYLDYSSFRFRIFNSATGKYEITNNPHEHKVREGTFKYVNNGDASSHVTFTPDPTIVSSNTTPTDVYNN